MKPKIDLNDPLIKKGLELLNKQSLAALNAPQTVEKSVIPIYALRKRKAHEIKKDKLEQIASGVLLNIKDQYFILSATHVFLEFPEYGLCTGDMDGGLIQQLIGERFSRGNPNKPNEHPLDASVYHIQSEMSETLKKHAITLKDMDLDGYDPLNPIYLASGFRTKKSNTLGNSINSKRETFPSIDYKLKDYKTLGYNPQVNLILSFEDQILVNNNWQLSPRPRGLSGGAIIKAKGTSIRGASKFNEITQQLSAIITEHHKDKNKQLGKLVGTRINIHLELINQFIPGLLEHF